MSDAEKRLMGIDNVVICYGIDDYGPVPEDIRDDVKAVLESLRQEREAHHAKTRALMQRDELLQAEGEKREAAEAKAAVIGGEWCAQNRAEGRGPCGACAICCQELRAQLAKAEAERDEARHEAEHHAKSRYAEVAGLSAACERLEAERDAARARVSELEGLLWKVAPLICDHSPDCALKTLETECDCGAEKDQLAVEVRAALSSSRAAEPQADSIGMNGPVKAQWAEPQASGEPASAFDRWVEEGCAREADDNWAPKCLAHPMPDERPATSGEREDGHGA